MKMFFRLSVEEVFRLGREIGKGNIYLKKTMTKMDGQPPANRFNIMEIGVSDKRAPIIIDLMKKVGAKRMMVQSRDEALAYMNHLMSTIGSSA